MDNKFSASGKRKSAYSMPKNYLIMPKNETDFMHNEIENGYKNTEIIVIDTEKNGFDEILVILNALKTASPRLK